MSLEQILSDNTAALNRLAEALTASLKATTTAEKSAATAALNSAVAATKDTEAKKSDATTASSQPGATPQSAGQKAAAHDTDKVAVTYDDVKAAILKLSTDKGREKAVAVLARHGAKKVPDLKPEQYAAVLKDANDTLAGVVDPEASMPEATLA